MTELRTHSEDPPRRIRMAHGLGAAVGAFIIGTVGLSVAIYVMGADSVAASGMTGDEMAMYEVTSTAAVGVASAVVSLMMGLVGVVTATGAAVLGLAVGALGIAGALIVGAGMVTGPILLIAALVLMVKRRFYPDVI